MKKRTEINNFRKTTISSTSFIDKVFKCNIVNRKLAYLHGGSLKFTLTVPLMQSFDPGRGVDEDDCKAEHSSIRPP